MEFLIPVAVQLVIRIPEIAVWIVGIYLALSRRQESPVGYLCAAIAFGIFLVLTVISTIVFTALPLLLVQQGRSATEVGLAFNVVNIATALIATGGWVLILIALFRRRML